MWSRTFTPEELVEETRWWFLLAAGLLLQLGALHTLEALRHGDWSRAWTALAAGAGTCAAGLLNRYWPRAVSLLAVAAFFTPGAAQGRLAPLAGLVIAFYYLLQFIRFRPRASKLAPPPS